MPSSPGHRLFSFGTLLDPAVQRHVFGHEVPAEQAELLGHRFVEVPIEDPEVVAASGLATHRGLARGDGETVPGGLLTLGNDELRAADRYEVAAYARRRVLTAGHGEVWAYLDVDPLQAAERIGVIGDSIAYGRGAAIGWAGLLGAAHVAADGARRRFFNLAIPGVTAADLTGFAADEARRRRCDTVFIAAGVNDLIKDPNTVERTFEHVTCLAEQVEAGGARPVVVGPLWADVGRTASEFGATLDLGAVIALSQALVAWGRTSRRDVVNALSVFQGRSKLLADGLHPNAEGHAALARAVAGERIVLLPESMQ